MEAAWRAGFQCKYIIQFVVDLSLAMTARCRIAWSQAILKKYLFNPNKSRCQRRSVVKSKVNSPRSASAKNKKSVKKLFGVASRLKTLRELITVEGRRE